MADYSFDFTKYSRWKAKNQILLICFIFRLICFELYLLWNRSRLEWTCFSKLVINKMDLTPKSPSFKISWREKLISLDFLGPRTINMLGNHLARLGQVEQKMTIMLQWIVARQQQARMVRLWNFMSDQIDQRSTVFCGQQSSMVQHQHKATVQVHKHWQSRLVCFFEEKCPLPWTIVSESDFTLNISVQIGQQTKLLSGDY